MFNLIRLLPRPGMARAMAIGLILVLGTEFTMAETDLGTVVKAREIAFAKTMADRDLSAFLTFVSTEAIFFNGNTPLNGKEAVKAAWSAFFEGADAPFSWQPDLVEVLDSGELAISSGPVLSAAGEAVGRFNSIWRKESDGEWRVVFDKGS